MQETTKQSAIQNDELKLFLPQHFELYEDGIPKEDLLHRRKTSDTLSSLLTRVADPLVVALDGKWGTGKTWFLQRWVGEHSKKNQDTSTVVYFDAFAYDYLSDPLPALVQALADRTAEDTIMQKLKETAFKLVKPLARVGLAAATSGASVIGGAVINAIGQETERNLDEYWKCEKGKHTAMKQFRTALESLADKEKGKKVIFVIDELDRCRPDYALEVLEVIKHFFSVPGVHFVLGVILVLPSDIGTTYKHTLYVLKYLDYLINQMGIPNHIGDPLKTQVAMVARANPISLRHIEHIVSAVKLASSEIKEKKKDNYPGMFAIMNDLIISRIVRPDLYPNFLEANISESDLKKYLGVTDDYPARNFSEDDFGMSLDFKAKISFCTWLFISKNENFEQVAESLKTKMLIEFYGPDHPYTGPDPLGKRELPKIIQREWLDLFQCYRPPS